jgi:hypothetical protein
MWISTARFISIIGQGNSAAGREAELRKQLAVMQQNFDWLANHVNRLEAERSTLLQRVLDVGFVSPQIARQEPPPAERVGMGAPINATDRPEGEDPGMALAAMMGGSFEDMGDEAAARFGVTHDPTTGTILYER